MKITFLVAAALCAVAALPAQAATVFAGSWTVDQGPSWSGSPPNGPLAYTGQEAAAMLFGGTASDYAISTIDNLVTSINNKAWCSIIGYGGGVLFAEEYSSKYLGQFYGPTSGYSSQDLSSAASTYVSDNARGAQYANFASRIDNAPAVPEPETWMMMLVGFRAFGCGDAPANVAATSIGFVRVKFRGKFKKNARARPGRFSFA